MANKAPIYKSQKWLNRKTSPSTGSVVAYSGTVEYNKKKHEIMYLEISDCGHKIRLDKVGEDTVLDFVEKLKTLKLEVSKFIKHLESEKV